MSAKTDYLYHLGHLATVANQLKRKMKVEQFVNGFADEMTEDSHENMLWDLHLLGLIDGNTYANIHNIKWLGVYR